MGKDMGVGYEGGEIEHSRQRAQEVQTPRCDQEELKKKPECRETQSMGNPSCGARVPG